MTILDKIIADKRREVEANKQLISSADLQSSPYFHRKCISLKERLNESTGIIAEFKRKSPSKGWIHENADVVEVTSGYSEAGAAGISILTDSKYFGGVQQELTAARPHVLCPILRKDFMIDEYQLYEAKSIGADVILLIAAALRPDECSYLAAKAKDLGLEVLLEIHSEDELQYCCDEVDLVGVNNRNLKTFEVSTRLSIELAPLIPDRFVKISESGLQDVETVKELMEYGYRGFLMGENFMKESDPASAMSLFSRKICL
jgi:indole-3-glycerol phosphate synthase